MIILSLETSTQNFSLAVSEDEKILMKRSLHLPKILDSSIIPAIDQTLKNLKLTVSDCDGFAVGLGPGSFTSLRVGLAAVKGLAFATGKSVVGLSSLDILAMNVFDVSCDEICVILDAKRNLLYGCLYRKKGESLKRTSEYLLIPLDELLDRVHGRTLFVGDGVGLYKQDIEKAYAAAARKRKTSCAPFFAPEKFWFPQASQLSLLAYGRFLKNEYDDIRTLTPIYLYPTDCQVKK